MDLFVINRCGSCAPNGRQGGGAEGAAVRPRDLQRGMSRFKTGDQRPGRRRPLIDTSPLIITSFPANRVAARARARDKSSRLVPTRERALQTESIC
jgi:hypothetical protein